MIRISAAIVVLFAFAQVARADEPPPTQEQLDAAKQAFDDAKTLYDAGKVVESIAKLKESLRLSRNVFLLYNIGHAYDQLGRNDKALAFYLKFLASAPADAPMRGEVQKRADQLRAEHVQADVPETYSASEFHHTVIDSAPPGSPIDVTATAPRDARFVVTLYYRAGGAESFASAPMTWRGNELVARIAADQLIGTLLHYYIEVKDDGGNVVTRSGKATSPNLVNIQASAAAHFDANARPGEDDPLKAIALREHAPPPPVKFERERWIVTGAAAALLGGTMTMYFLAKDHSDKLNIDSTSCGTPPCRAFDAAYDQGIESHGVRYNTLYQVGLGVTALAIGGAGYLWYRSLTGVPDRRIGARTLRSGSWAIAPAPAGVIAAAVF